MRKFYRITPTAWFAALALMPLSACSDLGTGAPEISKGESNVVAFKVAGLPYQDSSADDSEKLTSVNVFHFKGDEFMTRTDVDDPYAENIGIPNNGTTRVYCVSGAELSADEGLKESDFARTTITSPAGADSAPLFYSATADMDEGVLQSRQLTVELKRGVARIDFINDANSKIEIKQVIVEDAPASTFVFACDRMPDEATVRYSHEFSEPFYGSEAALFTLFESKNPVHVRIIGDYGDTPLNLRTTLPAVERNKIYTLQTVNVNSTVEGAFTIKDWEEGKNVGAAPSNANILIDRINSVVPEGVGVDYTTNTVTVPFVGVKDLKLAFLAKTKVSISSIDGEISTAKISANEPMKVEEGYISSFNLTVDPNKRLAYTVIINIKDEEGRHNFIEVNVLNNPTRTIETVEIAGATWMAFNCTGPDLNKQIYPVDGLSVEDTYKNNWVGAVGSLYQFGRQYAYIPYVGYNPVNNLGNQTQDMPWVNYSHMPCPEGYHVATLEEFRTLCPQNTPIPGTYTAGNGESITVTVHKIEGDLVTPTKVGGVGRYMKFKSNVTGNELILPIAGYKSDKSGTANPMFGKDAVYWTNSCVSCWGGHARAFRFMFNWGDESKMDEFQWPMEAFAYVRAIKNVETNEEGE